MQQQAQIGIIGGSGLYAMPGLTDTHEQTLHTPFGKPSDAYVIGSLEGRKVAFLARHGRGHRILPSELNFRANIYGFKQLGVDRILSVSAVGSLKEEHKPREFVIPDQFVDRTRHRVDTFFGDGIVAHIAFADPVCPQLSETVAAACQKAKVVGKRGGTYLCMEGPQFSTKAESNLYRSKTGAPPCTGKSHRAFPLLSPSDTRLQLFPKAADKLDRQTQCAPQFHHQKKCQRDDACDPRTDRESQTPVACAPLSATRLPRLRECGPRQAA